MDAVISCINKGWWVLIKSVYKNDWLYLILNRPEVKNAFNLPMLDALSRQLQSVPSTVRGVVLMGADGFFCSGMDLKELKRSRIKDESDGYLKGIRLRLQEVFEALESLPCVSVSFVEGGAYGGGVGLAMACDICCSLPSSFFCLSEMRQGLLPVQIMPLLSLRLPYPLITTMLLTGKPYKPEQLGAAVSIFSDKSCFVDFLQDIEGRGIRDLRILMNKNRLGHVLV